MTSGSAALEAFGEVADVSTAIAAALEARDLNTADRLLQHRAALLDGLLRRLPTVPDGDASALRRIIVIIDDAEKRSQRTLEASMAAARGQLGALTVGATAVRGYCTPEPFEPGFVDCRD